MRIVPTDHKGFQDSGWKSLIDKQSFVLVWNRPEGVDIMIEGGLNGYWEGKMTLP